jgi:hypothetical protein
MAITSASTLAQVQAEYENNADFESPPSPAKAQAFIVACRYLLVRLPSNMDHASGSGRRAIQRNLEVIQGELEWARAWVATNGAAGTAASAGARHFSFEDLRS